MNPPQAKALANSALRPVKTSKLNPYVMKKLPATGEIRVAPRMAAVVTQVGRHGIPAGSTKRSEPLATVRSIVEDKAHYATDKPEARATAASMLRGFRKTGNLRADLRGLVDFAKMDLGETYGQAGLCCSPMKSDANKKFYPSLYLSGKKKIDLPSKGKAVVEYVVRSKTTNQDSDGNVTESASIDILSIDPDAAADTNDKKPLPDSAIPTKAKAFDRAFSATS